MILQGGTNEISNLDVSGNSIDRIEALKEEIKASSVKMFSIAEESLTLNKGLENVIIFKRMFRCDDIRNDPAQIRAKLSEFGNRALDDIWLTKGCPQNIKIVQQTLECQGDLKTSRFGLASSHEYDGVHMRGKLAVQHYTGSIINALLDVLPNSTSTQKVNINKQPTYANIARKHIPVATSNQFMYNVPKKPSNSKSFFNFRQTQPLPTNTFTPAPELIIPAANHRQQSYRSPVHPTDSGTNRMPLGGRYQYNVPTENRFSAVSGN